MSISGTSFPATDSAEAAAWAGSAGTVAACPVSGRLLATRPQAEGDLAAAIASGEQADRRPPKH